MANLYGAYQAWSDMMAPARYGAQVMLDNRWAWEAGPLGSRFAALAHVLAETKLTHKEPPFGIAQVQSGNRLLDVREEVVFSLPFGNLLHFAKDDSEPKPKVLVVVPLSGHFATLLRNTVETLLRDHDVYITDWVNARDVPVSAGSFGFDDYVAYVIRFLEEMGPGANIVAVCQPCVHALAAVAVMAADDHPCQPRSMTLMGGPVDTRISPTVVNDLAMTKPIEWFRDNLISTVPLRYKGRGRKVYPGFMQLTAFMSMNMGRHMAQHIALYQSYADGEDDKAQGIRDFYDEYFAVLDLTAEFYLETVDRVFQRTLLAKGELTYKGAPVQPDKIRKTALLTVEGERDDICAVGQTAAAHDLCSSLRPHLKRHHLQPGVGHYGVFSGSKWERQIYPQIRSLILAVQ
ncbi:polyhydroxyalkanoate depolymerase [Sphingomonas immobilis]|uniref:Polyhydroxyalkanoate depolymerase n=1 Tax=Sphingomonas immobilis TaxID=3063997 RepID=A0ABT8ZXU9_9SPHN|nr:polyhydroxyalkanoate depolymerase [Sphingomonas sp. CA1-15]MDO7842118.1 polyhydroxyalkanoate depolymerase [Sphingomonas sp. CA1-15]